MYWNAAASDIERRPEKININMRCIEMMAIKCHLISLLRLTLTWDVLKYAYHGVSRKGVYRLTLTWDVLKFNLNSCCKVLCKGLTLTWDVLK